MFVGPLQVPVGPSPVPVLPRFSNLLYTNSVVLYPHYCDSTLYTQQFILYLYLSSQYNWKYLTNQFGWLQTTHFVVAADFTTFGYYLIAPNYIYILFNTMENNLRINLTNYVQGITHLYPVNFVSMFLPYHLRMKSIALYNYLFRPLLSTVLPH